MRKRRGLATSAVAAILAVSIAAPASAQPQNEQDGLVNIAIFAEDVIDVTVTDVNIGVAAQIAAQVCGVKVGPVAVLARQVDRSGAMRTVCDLGGGQELVLIQN
jgi:hypothetical protein